jgi:tetratricopeptide (TPR) repeat protein
MNLTADRNVCSYVGQRAFTSDEHAIFAGRGREVSELGEMWRQNALVVLDGPAGSGKTSLLQAGLTPAVAADGGTLSLGRLITPLRFPEPLVAARNPYALSLLSSWAPVESLASLSDESIGGFLRACRQRGMGTRGDDDRLLLVAIDQVEEILVGDEDRQARDDFLAELASAVRALPSLRLLLSIRTEALGRLAGYEQRLSPKGAARYSLDPLSASAAAEAISLPMAATGRKFGAGAVERLVDALSTGPERVVQPVQLQVACSALQDLVTPERDTVSLHLVRELDIGQALESFYAASVLEVADRYEISADELIRLIDDGLVGAHGDVVRADEHSLAAIGLPGAAIRALVNRHILIASNESGTDFYQFAGAGIALAARQLARSPASSGRYQATPAERMRIAESVLAEGNPALARKHADEALETVDPPDIWLQAAAQTLLGNIAYRMGQLDISERHYRIAAVLRERLGDRPAVGRLYGAIGCLYTGLGQHADALEAFQVALSRLPSDVILQTEMARALWRSGQSQAACAVFSAVLSVEPESAAALSGRGQIEAEQGNARAALDDLARLRQLRPNADAVSEVRSAYALALAVAGRTDVAMAEADAAAGAARDSAFIFLRAARVAYASGAFNRAAELLGQAQRASHPALSGNQCSEARRLRAALSGRDASGIELPASSILQRR